MTDCAQRRNPPPSNSAPALAALAERAGNLYRRSLTDWMRCAAVLLEARTVAQHGEWLPFLKAAGIPPRTAQRMIRIAGAGLQMRQLTHLGGVSTTLDLLTAEPDKMAELVSLHDELDEAHEREAVMLESATPEQRELIDRALANLSAIKALKSQLNSKVSKLADATRETAALRRRLRALEKEIADLEAA